MRFPLFVSQLGLICICGFQANAESLSYILNFSGGSPAPTFGAFTYDTTSGLFTSFDVTWNGVTMSLLPSANTPVTQNILGQNNCPTFSGQQFYAALVGGGQCSGLPLFRTWAVYPPNPPGNLYNSVFSLGLYTVNDEGAGIGANYPDPAFIATHTSGTFTVVPEPGFIPFSIIFSAFVIQRRFRNTRQIVDNRVDHRF